ncbi:hypothetical protein [Filomicrobium sp.]|uniref:hypothetical protein n=1 Tax=Filomicrobium sp. TaxID=2024831 RepID=UPI00258FB70A|nr:hypothetical protein [Filomicrobium sp.]MCV0369966.1 hypothetical protein [Filomicrobium sp.]
MTHLTRFFLPPVMLAAAAVGTVPATAADLYDGGERRPYAYEDQRYREIYEYPPPRAQVRHYEEREERHYRVRERYVSEPAPCLSPQEIERVLYEDGWHDIEDVEFEGRFMQLEARRVDTDREFDLVLDACSGNIVDAKPEDRRWARRHGSRY